MIDRHILLTNGRSGSNFVANTLNLHPEVVNFGEVLGEWTLPYRAFKKFSWLGRSNENYVDFIYSSPFIYYIAQLISSISHFRRGVTVNFKKRGNVKSIGVKDFSFLIQQRHLEDWLINGENIKVIYLYRENILKRYLSLVMMTKTGVIKSEANLKARSVSIDINDMLSELELYKSQRDYEEYIIEQLPHNRVIRLCYEDYFSSEKKMVSENNKMFDFLGVAPIISKSSHKKINPDNLATLIENLEEVKASLKGSDLYKYIEM